MTGKLAACCSALVLAGCSTHAVPKPTLAAADPAAVRQITIHVKDMTVILKIG
jgi:hypothetical protein